MSILRMVIVEKWYLILHRKRAFLVETSENPISCISLNVESDLNWRSILQICRSYLYFFNRDKDNLATSKDNQPDFV